MRVLVTGGAGFIGGHLCRELLDGGHHVRVIDDLSSGSTVNLGPVAQRGRFLGFVEGGVAEEQALRRALHGIDAVYHLGGRGGRGGSVREPAATFASDVAATFRLLEEVRQRRLRLLLVSSYHVYRGAPGDGALSEDAETRPASPLGGCKLAAEALVLSYSRAYDLPATVVRLFNTYGPGQPTTAVVPCFCLRALRGQLLPVHGDGQQRRDFMYVDDCVRLLRLAGESAAAVGEVLNGGSGLSLSIGELAHRVATATFARPGAALCPVEHPHPRSETYGLRCDPERARRLLGWRAEVPIDVGLRRTAAWLSDRA